MNNFLLCSVNELRLLNEIAVLMRQLLRHLCLACSLNSSGKAYCLFKVTVPVRGRVFGSGAWIHI
jgi:hypothetical protein